MKEKRHWGAKASELFFLWLQWVIVSYVLLSALVSLRSWAPMVLIFAANVGVIMDYRREIRRRMALSWAVCFFGASFLTLMAAYALFGYLVVGLPVRLF